MEFRRKEGVSEPRKVGRPRKHADQNARQRACRNRKRKRQANRELEAQCRRVIRENYDSKGRLPGEFSGGIDSDKIELIHAAASHTADGHRRVRPTGWSSDKNEETRAKDRKVETDRIFVERQSFPLDWKLDAADKREIVHELTCRIFSAEDRDGDVVFAPGVEDIGVRNILRCQICNQAVNIHDQAIEHVRTRHRDVCREAFRDASPKKLEPCNADYHAFLQSEGEKFCKRCPAEFVARKGFVTDEVSL